MSKSTRSRAARKPSKPDKPRDDFPLFPHDNGRWAKKVRGKLCYFGTWADDWKGDRALTQWIDQKDALLAGKPQPQITRGDKPGGLPLHQLVNDFLNAKRRLLDAGELTQRTFSEYHTVGVMLADTFGRNRDVSSLTAADFGRLRAQLAKRCGPVRLANEITRVRMVFRFGYDEGLIEKPIRYGQSFNKPAAKVIRKTRADNGARMFEPDELRRILDALKSDHVMRAIVLMGVNCGYGAVDVSELPFSALDLDGGWVTFPRPKTGIERRAKLWPETVAALRDYLETRPKPRDPADADLVFINTRGRRWLRQSASDDPAKWHNRTDMVGKRFRDVLSPLDINGRRGFYALRHTFQTAAEESRDLPAVMHVMGHSDSSMSARYRERITDERLEAVADAVRVWLFGTEGGAE